MHTAPQSTTTRSERPAPACSGFATRDVLAIASAATSAYGWVPASQDGSTKAMVLQALTGRRGEVQEVLGEIAPHIEEGRAMVDAIVEAALSRCDGRPGYTSDLAQALTREVTPLADVGLVCSAVGSFLHPADGSAPAGLRVGERVSVKASVRKVVEVLGPSPGTTSHLIVVDTERGAMRFTSPAGWAAQLVVGDQLTVEGVVSAFEFYRGSGRAVLGRPRASGNVLRAPADGGGVLTGWPDGREGGRRG